MKIKKGLLLIAISGLMLGSCYIPEDDDVNLVDPKPTKTELLTTGSWIEFEELENGKSVWSKKDTCQWDNFLTYKSDGTGIYDQGEEMCDTTVSQTASFYWAFAAKQTKLISDGLDYGIIKLTPTQMYLKDTIGGVIILAKFRKKL